MSLVIFSTHPIQYQAPLYRLLQADFSIPVTAIYGSDFSVVGYQDQDFGVRFAWDTDLLAGYTSLFLSHSLEGGAQSPGEVSSRGLARALKGVQADAVLLTGYRPRFDLGAFLVAWRKGYPLLFRAETTDHAQPRGPVKGWVRDRFLHWFYRRMSCLLYIGRRSLEHYRRLGVGEQRLVFSPYGVDTTVFCLEEKDRERMRVQTREALELPVSRQVVLFSGKLVDKKGPDLLLRAVKELPEALRERTVVLFLGDGPLRQALQRLAGSPPATDVRFVGFQNQRDLSLYYHAADLCAMPSLSGETWGLVVNEALHHGLPCVVSSGVGCAPDLVEAGVTGEIFEAGSAYDLGRAIQRAMTLVGRPEVQARCRERAGRYTLGKAAEGIARAYWAVMGAGEGSDLG